MKFISKTRYMNGLQCLKLLWLSCNDRAKIAPPDAATQRIFDQGQAVGALARTLFASGFEVPQADFMGNIRETKELLKDRIPLYEAGIMAEGLFCRLDILNPIGEDQWDIIEVKSSTSVKEENFQDLAFQKVCCQKAGLNINRCWLAHINNQYVRRGEIVAGDLFTVEDLSEGVISAGEGIEDRIDRMFEVMAGKEPPETLVGPQCTDPYDCPVELCREELPENNILSLYRGGKRCFEFLNQGIFFLKDIPESTRLEHSQQKQRWCDLNNQAYVEKPAIRAFIATLQPPFSFLDFETFSTAIPLFQGTRPYQRIPFQYSLHVREGTGKKHLSYLAEGLDDPRPGFLRQLKADLGEEGSIITYNQSFEESVLRELAEAFPDQGRWVDGICSRLRDLYKPFRKFDYYHPAQNGSASIKNVLPALTGQSYDSLEISGGEDASAAYLEMQYGGLSQLEKDKIRSALSTYCGLDTEGMIWILDKLRELC